MKCKQPIYHILSFIIFFFAACTNQIKKAIYCGTAVQSVHLVFDSSKHKFADSNNYTSHLWYKDNYAIEKVMGVELDFIDKKPISRMALSYYRFSDLNNQVCYNYSNFSDTASIVARYFMSDTTLDYQWGWTFYKNIPQLYFKNGFKKLTDTIIANINYSRITDTPTYHIDNNDYTHFVVGYIRCDKKGVIIEMDKIINKKIGCPLVKVEDMSIDGKRGFVDKIDFIRDSLTAEELKVFAAWEKNAREHPVK